MKNATPFAALRQFARPKIETDAQPICDFCSVPLFPQHRHLLEVAHRRIICACEACALRFDNVIGGRFRLIPRDSRALHEFQMSDSQWENLALPINLVFIFQNGATGKATAIYPGPAGAMESSLTLDNWHSVLAENPELEEMKPDVEALLINRIGLARDYFIVPVDVCFELAGLIRSRWRGFSGGDDVWHEIEKFFGRLHEHASPVGRQRFPERTATEVYA